jgi:hypothetical protein
MHLLGQVRVFVLEVLSPVFMSSLSWTGSHVCP